MTSTLVFEENNQIKQYPGGYTDWLSKGQALESKDNFSAMDDKNGKVKGSSRQTKLVKLSYKEEYELDELPEKIEKLEHLVQRLEAQILEPDFYNQPWESIGPVVEDLEQKQSSLEELTTRWEELEKKKRRD